MTFRQLDGNENIGTISEVLAAHVIDIPENDGMHIYRHIQEECKSQLPISSESKWCIQPLTNPGVHITQFDKSFITLTVKVGLQLDTALTKTDAEAGTLQDLIYEGIRVFIGWKNATDAIREYSIYHKGKQVTGTLQSHATQESFLYHTIRGQDDLEYHKGRYSLAEAVAKCDYASYCGQYVSLKTLAEAGTDTFYLTFDLQIPYCDLLCFQQFEEYPNEIFGKLELYFKFNKDSLVYIQTDPAESIPLFYKGSRSLYPDLDDDTLGKSLLELQAYGSVLNYTREYTQINDSATIINSATNGLKTNEITIRTVSMQIVDCFSTICGTNMEPEKLEAARLKYQSEPWGYFTQNVNFLPYTTSATSNGLFVTQQTYLNNTTDFVITFPTTENEITVLKNPMLKEFRLTTMNVDFPELALDFSSPRFVEIMMKASDQEYSKPRREYAQSLTVPREIDGSQLTPAEDLTSFMVTLHVERPSAYGMIQDGIDSEGQQVSVRLKATPLYNNDDSYCNSSPPPPVLYTVNDAAFLFNSQDGGRCLYTDRALEEVIPAFMSQ